CRTKMHDEKRYAAMMPDQGREALKVPGGFGRAGHSAGSGNPDRTAVDKVAHAIVEGIKAGIYAPGQRLIEADLTRDLGVSRGPVREATRRLGAEGILDVLPHRGAVVRKLSRRDVAAIYQIRELLEGLAARLSAN